MPIYAMKRCFANGRPTKRTIVFFNAADKREAHEAFGAGRFWGGYHENTGFTAIEVSPEDVPKNTKILVAAETIKWHKEEYE